MMRTLRDDIARSEYYHHRRRTRTRRDHLSRQSLAVGLVFPRKYLAGAVVNDLHFVLRSQNLSSRERVSTAHGVGGKSM